MKATLRHIWSVLHPEERRKYSFLIFADIIVNILDIVFLAGLVWIVHLCLRDGPIELPSCFLLWLHQNPSMLIVIFFILFSTKNAAAFYITKLQNDFAAGIALRISTDNLQRFQHASFTDFVNRDSSNYVREIIFQPNEFCQFLLGGAQQIITQAALIVFTGIAIIWFNPRVFFLLIVILLPPALIVFYLVRKKLGKIKAGLLQANRQSFRYLMDALKGYVEGNVYGRNEFFLSRFRKQRSDFSRAFFNSLSWQSLPARFIEVFLVLGLFLLILISRSYYTGGTTFVTLGAFMAAAYKIIPGLVKIINTGGQIKAYEISMQSLKNKVQIPQHPPSNHSIRSIEFSQVNFSYGAMHVLRNFNIHLSAGDFLGLTGRSGVGKTTVLNLFLGFLEPEFGQIRINGREADGEQRRSFWPGVAYVRQQPFLIHDSILRNITLSEKDYDAQRLATALELSGLDEMVAASPEGLEKSITENGTNISGGQRQRVALARAIYKNADVILLDEPFNELDEGSEQKLLQSIRKLADEGKIIIMITHHLASLSACTKIVSLDEQA